MPIDEISHGLPSMALERVTKAQFRFENKLVLPLVLVSVYHVQSVSGNVGEKLTLNSTPEICPGDSHREVE